MPTSIPRGCIYWCSLLRTHQGYLFRNTAPQCTIIQLLISFRMVIFYVSVEEIVSELLSYWNFVMTYYKVMPVSFFSQPAMKSTASRSELQLVNCKGLGKLCTVLLMFFIGPAAVEQGK